MQTTKKSVFTNLIWRFAERCGAEVLQILVSIVLARILAPEAFGTIALLLVFSNNELKNGGIRYGKNAAKTNCIWKNRRI